MLRQGSSRCAYHAAIDHRAKAATKVKERLASVSVCPYFGTPISAETAHVDHRIPRSRGGSNKSDNLEAVSALANQMKSDLTVEEFLDAVRAIYQYRNLGSPMEPKLPLVLSPEYERVTLDVIVKLVSPQRVTDAWGYEINEVLARQVLDALRERELALQHRKTGT